MKSGETSNLRKSFKRKVFIYVRLNMIDDAIPDMVELEATIAAKRGKRK